jgi:nitrite reductase/ring-hydroxylating ferredoxin subunit
MSRHVVARVDEIPLNGSKVVTIAKRSIGVFHLESGYYAIRNRCPHQGGPLCLGRQVGTVESEQPGEYNFKPDPVIIRCPWHQWEFDVRTGQSWFDPTKIRVRAYDAYLAPGADLLATDGVGERIPGPFVAESYPVSVEEEYIVVELDRKQAAGESRAA